MLFNTKMLSEHFDNYHGSVSRDIWIHEVVTDSRKKMDHALFIPLVGDTFDGHDYIDEAIRNGAIALICQEASARSVRLPKGFPVFYVEDTLTALQSLAQFYRERVNPTVVGITGSNGKTTTKDLVTSIGQTTYETHATKGNFNNHIGLPLTILSMPQTTELLVLEMGMNDFGEIATLSHIAQPDYAIITNIGESHIEYLGSRLGIAKAKQEILDGMSLSSKLIIDGDEPLLDSGDYQNTVMTCGLEQTNDVVISDVTLTGHQTKFHVKGLASFTIPLLGVHHAKNATYAIVLAKELGISLCNIHKGLKSLKQTGMRFELLTGKNDVTIINDAYNASPTSMKAAINVVKEMSGFKEKVLVLGDIFELGEHSEAMHQDIANVIGAPIDAVFTYGEAARIITETVTKQQPELVSAHFETVADLLVRLETYLTADNLVLFKASRGMKFEEIIEAIRV